MNITKFIRKAVVSVAAVTLAAIVIGGASASASQITYVPGQPLPSLKNPVFNTYTNVPFSVGNEADFVRVRPSTGDPTDNGSTGQRNSLYVDTLNAACNVGDMYDIRTYIHNGADDDYNENGNGSAIAHGVTVSMQAKLNETRKSFPFTSTISATNAASVTDNGTLNCGSDVRLQLVPSTVRVYSKSLGWSGAPDSSVNGSVKIGSEKVGSGDVWGCWDERLVVVYVVKVVEVPKVPEFKCDLLSITKLDNRKYKFDVKYTNSSDVTFKGISYNYGDKKTGSEDTHTYDKDGSYTVVATVSFMVNGQVKSVSGKDCAKPITVTPENCEVPGKENYPKGAPECEVCDTNPNLPYDSPKCNEVPPVLPNTGAGNIAGIFAAISAAGAVAYRYAIGRRIEV